METGNEIVLKVVSEDPEVVYENGIPVILGKGPADVDIVDLIRNDRDARIEKLAKF